MIGGRLKKQAGGPTENNHELRSLTHRTKIRIDKVIVHENYTKNANDIALLKLGKDDPRATRYLIQDLFSEERVDLSVYSPACLPDSSSNPVGQNGHVYGEKKE